MTCHTRLDLTGHDQRNLAQPNPTPARLRLRPAILSVIVKTRSDGEHGSWGTAVPDWIDHLCHPYCGDGGIRTHNGVIRYRVSNPAPHPFGSSPRTLALPRRTKPCHTKPSRALPCLTEPYLAPPRPVLTGRAFERSEWDSNPRWLLRHSALAGRCIEPDSAIAPSCLAAPDLASAVPSHNRPRLAPVGVPSGGVEPPRPRLGNVALSP